METETTTKERFTIATWAPDSNHAGSKSRPAISSMPIVRR